MWIQLAGLSRSYVGVQLQETFLTTRFALIAAIRFRAVPAIASATMFQKVKIEAGQALFETACRRCHAVEATDASYDPPLENVVGRRAGTYETYDCSIALEASVVVRVPAALCAWMVDNDGFMPGTKIRQVGIEDQTVQDFCPAQLASMPTLDESVISKGSIIT